MPFTYVCECCHFKNPGKNLYEKHLMTRKHIELSRGMPPENPPKRVRIAKIVDETAMAKNTTTTASATTEERIKHLEYRVAFLEKSMLRIEQQVHHAVLQPLPCMPLPGLSLLGLPPPPLLALL